MPPAFEATATLPPGLGPREAGPSRWPAWIQRMLHRVRPAASDALDRSTGLLNRAGLMAAANDAMRGSADGAPLAMVVLEFSDVREVHHIYGSAIASKVLARVIRRLRVMAGSSGFAGRTGPSQFTVVLPGASRDKALRQVQRALGKPARVEFDAGDSEIVVVPDLLVDTAEPGTQAQALYREMCLELARIRKHEMRRLHWLANERERHSRPMSLPVNH